MRAIPPTTVAASSADIPVTGGSSMTASKPSGYWGSGDSETAEVVEIHLP